MEKIENLPHKTEYEEIIEHLQAFEILHPEFKNKETRCKTVVGLKHEDGKAKMEKIENLPLTASYLEKLVKKTGKIAHAIMDQKGLLDGFVLLTQEETRKKQYGLMHLMFFYQELFQQKEKGFLANAVKNNAMKLMENYKKQFVPFALQSKK